MWCSGRVRGVMEYSCWGLCFVPTVENWPHPLSTGAADNTQAVQHNRACTHTGRLLPKNIYFLVFPIISKITPSGCWCGELLCWMCSRALMDVPKTLWPRGWSMSVSREKISRLNCFYPKCKYPYIKTPLKPETPHRLVLFNLNFEQLLLQLNSTT